jgi:hypothetical protein
VIDFQVDSVWTGFLIIFDNAETPLKSGGNGTTQIGYPGFPIYFTNTGTVAAETGTILFETSYSDTLSANLSISLGGSLPGSGYGQIHFANPPTFPRDICRQHPKQVPAESGRGFRRRIELSAVNGRVLLLESGSDLLPSDVRMKPRKTQSVSDNSHRTPRQGTRP